jgi:hypothetical protein
VHAKPIVEPPTGMHLFDRTLRLGGDLHLESLEQSRTIGPGVGVAGSAPFDKSPKKKPGKKSKPGHQPTDFKPGDYQGTISTISVDRNGKVREIYFKLAGNVRTILIDGCGMKTADHPLLLWAFTEKRLLYIGTDDNRCFARMSLKKP